MTWKQDAPQSTLWKLSLKLCSRYIWQFKSQPRSDMALDERHGTNVNVVEYCQILTGMREVTPYLANHNNPDLVDWCTIKCSAAAEDPIKSYCIIPLQTLPSSGDGIDILLSKRHRQSHLCIPEWQYEEYSRSLGWYCAWQVTHRKMSGCGGYMLCCCHSVLRNSCSLRM